MQDRDSSHEPPLAALPGSPPTVIWRTWAREGWIVWRLGFARLWPRWWIVLLIVGLGAAVVVWNREWDNRLLEIIRVPVPNEHPLMRAARAITDWGDYIWSAVLAVGLWSLGVISRRARWRKLAWACLLAALTAGLITNVFRSTLGRARPSSGLADGFYGPSSDRDYHSFPSGHSTASFATAVAVAVGSPALGVPCLFFATTVGWSRMQVNAHHPADVVTGAALGALVGLCFGSAASRASFRLRRKRRRPSGQSR